MNNIKSLTTVYYLCQPAGESWYSCGGQLAQIIHQNTPVDHVRPFMAMILFPQENKACCHATKNN